MNVFSINQSELGQIDELFPFIFSVPKIGCIWPNSNPIDQPFDDQLALHFFPLVLANLRQIPAFHPVLSLLNSIRLPSLLHLLLFYVHRAYLGILPFSAVQEYLLIALIGGPEFQVIFPKNI